jgi:hypothetical protein
LLTSRSSGGEEDERDAGDWNHVANMNMSPYFCFYPELIHSPDIIEIAVWTRLNE